MFVAFFVTLVLATASAETTTTTPQICNFNGHWVGRALRTANDYDRVEKKFRPTTGEFEAYLDLDKKDIQLYQKNKGFPRLVLEMYEGSVSYFEKDDCSISSPNGASLRRQYNPLAYNSASTNHTGGVKYTIKGHPARGEFWQMEYNIDPKTNTCTLSRVIWDLGAPFQQEFSFLDLSRTDKPFFDVSGVYRYLPCSCTA